MIWGRLLAIAYNYEYDIDFLRAHEPNTMTKDLVPDPRKRVRLSLQSVMLCWQATERLDVGSESFALWCACLADGLVASAALRSSRSFMRQAQLFK